MTPFKLTLSLHPFSIVRLTSYSGYASLMVDPVHRSRLVSTQKVDAKNDARLSEVGGSNGPARLQTVPGTTVTVHGTKGYQTL